MVSRLQPGGYPDPVRKTGDPAISEIPIMFLIVILDLNLAISGRSLPSEKA
ncbi:MAG: hypothetical protein A4E35_01946 [Methanoregula sp. PtaU1.Bin051]|nr:MAG: hypothetical protein A4E35_01946 [Methanoregula sp. PtaU1.Bin051]